jgi:hypothetical protein
MAELPTGKPGNSPAPTGTPSATPSPSGINIPGAKPPGWIPIYQFSAKRRLNVLSQAELTHERMEAELKAAADWADYVLARNGLYQKLASSGWFN